jgi:ribonuclease-3
MGLTELIQSNGQQRSHNSYMAGNAFEALVGAIYLDQGYDAVMQFMKKRILAQMVNIDKVAYKEVNFKSKLLEWTQKNRVRMEYKMLKQTTDEQGSPIFGYVVLIEGVEGGKGQGYSKKEAQQISSKETLQKLRQEPQFIDAIFQAKSDRTKMEEEPVAVAPSITSESSATSPEKESFTAGPSPKKRESLTPSPSRKEKRAETPSAEEDDEFDLSDITHNPAEQSKEDIIAAAEAAAFAEQ